MRNQWSVSSHDGAMARYTVNTLLTSLIGLKERCVFCGEKPNKYLWQDIPQSMRPLHSYRELFFVMPKITLTPAGFVYISAVGRLQFTEVWEKASNPLWRNKLVKVDEIFEVSMCNSKARDVTNTQGKLLIYIH